MKRRLLIIPILSILLVWSCELGNEDFTGTTAQRLEGQWLCNETATLYKSTIDQYKVYIEIHPVDSNQILIENFYQLSNDITVVATINGMTITLPRQTTSDGFEVNGSGTISSNFNKITWRYYVDDGSGFEDQVDAIYTKV
jgi:hypothetical protein